jgi:hypothetical protein
MRTQAQENTVTIEQLRATQMARPFEPFTLHLADRRKYRINHPDIISSHPLGRTIIVYKPGLNGDLEILDLLLVVGIEVHKSRSSRRRRRKGA